VRYLQGHYPVSARHACRLARIADSVYYYRPCSDPQVALRVRIRDLARSRLRYGYMRIHVLLAREGIHVNKKRVHRLYCLEGLQLRPRRPRRSVSAARRQPPRVQPSAPNVAWSMDFVSDATSHGERFRALTVVDVFTRECLAIQPGRQLRAEDVARVLHSLTATHGAPERIYCDNVLSAQSSPMPGDAHPVHGAVSTMLSDRRFGGIAPAVFRGHPADHNEHKVRRVAAAFNELKTA
jgi:putative transposase